MFDVGVFARRAVCPSGCCTWENGTGACSHAWCLDCNVLPETWVTELEYALDAAP